MKNKPIIWGVILLLLLSGIIVNANYIENDKTKSDIILIGIITGHTLSISGNYVRLDIDCLIALLICFINDTFDIAYFEINNDVHLGCLIEDYKGYIGSYIVCIKVTRYLGSNNFNKGDFF